MSKSRQTAEKFLNACHERGFCAEVQGTVVKVNCRFTPGDADAYVQVEGQATMLLDMLGAKGGSMWGSTSDGIGGAVALNSGKFRLCVSGVPKRVSNALVKLLAS